jgi:hypothetical protein
VKLNVAVRGLTATLSALKAYDEEMQAALDAGTKSAATAIRNATQAELRTAGTGREYRSRRGRTTRRLEADIARLSGLVDSGQSSQRADLSAAQLRLQRAIKKRGKRPGDLHRAAEVGRAPAPDVGLLPQAVKAGKREGAYRVGVGGEWAGWEALHEGLGRLTGRRPFLELGIARMRSRLAGIWTRAVQARKGPA